MGWDHSSTPPFSSQAEGMQDLSDSCRFRAESTVFVLAELCAMLLHPVIGDIEDSYSWGLLCVKGRQRKGGHVQCCKHHISLP